jgi:hypothetical protein
MIIKDSHSQKTHHHKSFRLKKGRFLKWMLVFFALITVFTGLKLASNRLKTMGYSGLPEFIEITTSNYWKGRNAHPEVVSIEIKDKDLKLLSHNRDQALQRGLIVNDLDGAYVPATLEYHGKKIKVKLRLKGHMTDHLQNNKWSFRIKIKDKDSFMGMKRFSFQHPGTRGYVYEWIYHELMKREGIIALRYVFINVMLNGKDWGIYAVEENFDEELITNNHRMAGPIIRFNPEMNWVDRYNELLGQKTNPEFASYYAANPEAYRENKIIADSTQLNYYLKANALIEGLRSKKLSVDQVFDIPRLAKYHAITDLVGGQKSIDWSDIKYYYNPVSKLLEPVAYESFTAFPATELAGMYKYVVLDSTKFYEDWHLTLFSNTVFFKAYIAELERITAPSFLDSFFDETATELDEQLAILSKEFPYKKFEKNGYYKNQLMIKQMLNSPKALHAYYKGTRDKYVDIQIGSTEALPIEIKSVQIGNELLRPLKPIILPSKQPNVFVAFKDYLFVPSPGFKCHDPLAAFMQVNYAFLGSAMNKQERIFPFPHTDEEFIKEDLNDKKGTVSAFSFLVVDEQNKLIRIEKGTHVIQSNLIIPAGYRIIANAGISLDLKNKAKIISYSPAFFTGTTDDPVIVKSSDGTGQGIQFISAAGSAFKYVVFEKLTGAVSQPHKISGALAFYESSVSFMCCNFYEGKGENAVSLIRSEFSLKECLFHDIQSNALLAQFSNGTLTNVAFEDCKTNAIYANASTLTLSTITATNINKVLSVNATSQIQGKDVRIKNAMIAVSAEGAANVTISGLTLTDVKTAYEKEKNSVIEIDGIAVTNEAAKSVSKQ